MSALDIEIGGKHYIKYRYQPIQLITMLDLDFPQGNIVKYVSRYDDKNGKEDLKKAVHYTQYMDELSQREPMDYFDKRLEQIEIFVKENNMNPVIYNIIYGVCMMDSFVILTGIKKLYLDTYKEELDLDVKLNCL